MKRTRLVAVAMVGTLTVSSIVPSTQVFALEKTKGWSYGDVDKDGDVDPSDAMKVLQFYTEELATQTSQSLPGADVTLDGHIDCEDANEILTAYVSRTLAGREYFMPCECPIQIGTSLKYAGEQAWFRYMEPKTVSSLGTIVPGNELQIVRYCGSEWYEVKIDGSQSFVNIPEGEIGQTFLVCTNESDQTTSATTTTTTVTTSTSTTKSTTTTSTITSTTKPTNTTSTTTSTTKSTTTTSTTTSTTKPTTTASTTTSTTKSTTTTSTTTSTTNPTTTTSTTTSTTKSTTTTSMTTSTTKPTTTTTNIETTPNNADPMFTSGQYIKISENYHFPLKDDSKQDVKWLIAGDVAEICSFVAKRDNVEEYMVKIASYHAPLFGFDPETELHMVIQYGTNCVELVDFVKQEPQEPQIEVNTPFEVKDYLRFKGVGWKLLNEKMEMTGKYLENSNRFSIEEVVFKDEKGCLYRVNVSKGLSEFETAYIYICGADKAQYFELTDHL